MLNIEAIEIKRVVIHKIDYLRDKIDFAEKEESPSQNLYDYFDEHIRNVINSTSVKTSKFKTAETTIALCIENIIKDPNTLVEQTKIMTYWFYNNYEKSNNGLNYLAFIEFLDVEDNNKYIAILKLDPVKNYCIKEGSNELEQIITLPDSSRVLNRALIARPYNHEAKYDLLHRNQSQGKNEDPNIGKQWLDGFIEAVDVPTPKYLTQLVVKETEKWINSNETKLNPEESNSLRNTIKTLAQSEELDVTEAADMALKEEEMKINYINNLLEKGLPETSFTPDRSWAERAARKTTFVCDYNVTISGNQDAIREIMTIEKESNMTVIHVETKKFSQK